MLLALAEVVEWSCSPEFVVSAAAGGIMAARELLLGAQQWLPFLFDVRNGYAKCGTRSKEIENMRKSFQKVPRDHVFVSMRCGFGQSRYCKGKRVEIRV
jgi:hypothetical protein